MEMDLFNYQAFVYDKNKTYGLKSLKPAFQKLLANHFKCYQEVPVLFSEPYSKKFSKKQIKKKFFNCVQQNSNQKFINLILNDQFLLSLPDKKIRLMLKKIGRFIEFSPKKLLYTAQLLTELIKLLQRALDELTLSKSKIPVKFYKDYFHHLNQLKNKLTGEDCFWPSEKERIIICALYIIECYSQHRHCNLLYETFKKIKKIPNLNISHLKINRLSDELSHDDFFNLHQIIIQLGGRTWYQSLLNLPWTNPEIEKDYLNLKQVIHNQQYIIIPTALENLIPAQLHQPEKLFRGSSLRYHFFRHQFLLLINFNIYIKEIKNKIEKFSLNKDKPNFKILLELLDYIVKTQVIIKKFLKTVQPIKWYWFLKIFSSKTIKFFSIWEALIKEQQQKLNIIKNNWGNFLIEHIKTVKREKNFYNHFDEKSYKHIRKFLNENCKKENNLSCCINFFKTECHPIRNFFIELIKNIKEKDFFHSNKENFLFFLNDYQIIFEKYLNKKERTEIAPVLKILLQKSDPDIKIIDTDFENYIIKLFSNYSLALEEAQVFYKNLIYKFSWNEFFEQENFRQDVFQAEEKNFFLSNVVPCESVIRRY